MLGSIVLLGVAVAGCVVAGILFVLFGPVPVNRKVVMVSRIQPSMPVAAAPMFAPPVYEPEPEPIVSAPPPRKVVAVEPPRVAPLVLRRPRTGPAPLPRTRLARGTNASELHAEEERTQLSDFLDHEMTFVEAAR